jgi:hypothetical protein
VALNISFYDISQMNTFSGLGADVQMPKYLSREIRGVVSLPGERESVVEVFPIFVSALFMIARI